MKANNLLGIKTTIPDYHSEMLKVHLDLEESDEDSLEIRVENVNNKTHKDFHIKYQDEAKKLILYIDLCPADIQNLMKEGSLLRNKQDD